MARQNFHFSKAFYKWWDSQLKAADLTRKDFFSGGYSFSIQGVYDAFRAGQEDNTKTNKFEKEFRALQKKMKAAYDKGDIKALDELTEEVIFL